MCAKALRLLMSIPILLGSLAAYPQKTFPENLQSSIDHWNQLVEMTGEVDSEILLSKWEAYNASDLDEAQAEDLTKAMNLSDFTWKDLSKKDRQFLFKHGHLAFFLSGFNPTSMGENDRAGLWMLTYPDARRNGLNINSSIDERFDIAKSTRAARLHFEDLKKIHGGNTETAFVLGSVNIDKVSAEEIEGIEADLTALRLVNRSLEKSISITNKRAGYPTEFKTSIDRRVLIEELEINSNEFQLLNPTVIGPKIPAEMEVQLPMEEYDVDLVAKNKEFEESWKKRQDSIMNRIKKNVPSPQSHKVITCLLYTSDAADD